MSTFRPRSAAEIADAAIQLVRRHYAALLPLTALLSIPSVLLGLVTARAGPVDAAAPTPGQVAGAAIPSLIAAVWWFVALGALVVVASAAYLGEPLDPMAGARRAFARAGALVGANLLASLLALLAFLAVGLAVAMVLGVGAVVLLPGGAAALDENSAVFGTLAVLAVLVAMLWPALVFARYVVLTPVIVAEGAGALDALRRSKQLSEGFVWRSLGLLVVSLVILLATMLTAMGLASLVVGNEQAASALATLVIVPLYPAWACLLTVLYYDLRIRKEGYDIELMARAMGGGVAPAPDAAAGAPVAGAGH